jgi:hypothetical protein
VAAAHRASKRESSPFDRQSQSAADGLQGPLPVLDDVSMGALTRVATTDAELFADRHHLGRDRNGQADVVARWVSRLRKSSMAIVTVRSTTARNRSTRGYRV